jgi:hypothetical protein
VCEAERNNQDNDIGHRTARRLERASGGRGAFLTQACGPLRASCGLAGSGLPFPVEEDVRR